MKKFFLEILLYLVILGLLAVVCAPNFNLARQSSEKMRIQERQLEQQLPQATNTNTQVR